MNRLTIKIHNVYSYIYGFLPDTVGEQLLEKLSYKVQGSNYSEAYNTFIYKCAGCLLQYDDTKLKVAGIVKCPKCDCDKVLETRRKWDGRQKLAWKRKNQISLYTGLISHVFLVLNENGIQYDVVDMRVKPVKSLNLEFNKPYKLRPYQEHTVNEAVKKQRGIIKAATGAGKTIMASGILQRLNVNNCVFMATSGDLIIQTKEEFEKFLSDSGQPLKVGIIGAGHCDIQDINVMTVQTACAALGVKYEDAVEDDSGKKEKKMSPEILAKKREIKELLEKANVIIFDEVQHAACNTVKEVMNHCKNAFYRYGLSASPWRDDKKDLEISSFFSKREHTAEEKRKIKYRRSQNDDCLESVDGYIVDISASYLIREGHLVKPYIYFYKINSEYRSYIKYRDAYKNYIVDYDKRNKIVAHLTERLLAKDHNVLILVKQKNHGKHLEKTIPGSVFISGTMTNKKRKQMLDELREGTIKVAIATSIFDEGIDVKRLSALILAGSGKSSTRALQRVGRVIRPFEENGIKKEKAIVIDFLDTQKYLIDHSNERIKILKTEPEFEISMRDDSEVYN